MYKICFEKLFMHMRRITAQTKGLPSTVRTNRRSMIMRQKSTLLGVFIFLTLVTKKDETPISFEPSNGSQKYPWKQSSSVWSVSQGEGVASQKGLMLQCCELQTVATRSSNMLQHGEIVRALIGVGDIIEKNYRQPINRHFSNYRQIINIEKKYLGIIKKLLIS